MKYDYFVAGRWTNYANLKNVVEAIRARGKRAYSCIENEYDGDGIIQSKTPTEDQLATDNISHIKDWQTNPTFKKMFEIDMNGLKESKAIVIVFPAGLSTHMELGVAYGMGKKCYAIGKPDKTETLYLMFDKIFENTDDFLRHLS